MFDEKYQKQYLKNLAIESQLLNSMTSYSEGVFQKKQQELYHIDDNYIPSTENPLNIQPDAIVQDELLNIESEKQALQLNLFKITNSTVINDDIIAKLSDLEIQYLNVFFEDFKTKLKEKKIKLKTTTQLVDFIKKYLEKNSNAISKGDLIGTNETGEINVKEEKFNVPTPKKEEELQSASVFIPTPLKPKNKLNKSIKQEDSDWSNPLLPDKANEQELNTETVFIPTPNKPNTNSPYDADKESQLTNPAQLYYLRNEATTTYLRTFLRGYFLYVLNYKTNDSEYQEKVLEIKDKNLNNVQLAEDSFKTYKIDNAPKQTLIYIVNDLNKYLTGKKTNAEKGGLGLKKKQRRHQGNGIDSKDFEKGKIYCDIAKLNELILSIKYRNTGNKKTNDIPINENIKSIILDICLKKFDNAKYNKLSKEEQKVIIYFIEEMKIDNVKIDNNPINGIYTEYKILMGEIESGNDSSLIKKRLKTILFELHKYKKINSAQLRNIMFTIDNSN